jgi:hypothetical protein
MTNVGLNMSFLAPTQLFQLIMQFPPLDLGDTQLLADFIGFLTGAVIVQGAGPAAHVKRKMLRQAGLIPDILE